MRGACLAVGLLLVSVLSAGCVSEEDLKDLAEKFEESGSCPDSTSVSTQGGSFRYGGAAACKTASERVDWPNNMPRADLAWSGAVAKGSVHTKVLDGAGRTVQEFRIDDVQAEAREGMTDYGVPGPGGATWTFVFEFQNFTGSLEIRASGSL